MKNYDLTVIGGGAAGVMAAGIAASGGKRVLLCERMEKPQRKVRITGKGRCNLTNTRERGDFLEKIRANREFFVPAFEAFDNRQTIAFFEKIGVPLTEERGDRVFPTSGKAWDIADAHIKWCKKQGVEVVCHCRVLQIHQTDGHISGITVQKDSDPRESFAGSKAAHTGSDGRFIACEKVILATGGASYPATGSTGDGYKLAAELGHRIIEIRPSLTPLRIQANKNLPIKRLALRNVKARLLVDNQAAAEEFGEIEFEGSKLGGPITLRFSRQAVDALRENKKVTVELDLKPALNRSKLRGRIHRELEALAPRSTVHHLLNKLLPAGFIPVFLHHIRIPSQTRLQNLSEQDIQTLIEALKSYRIPITGFCPFEEAIVTAGGIAVEEIDPQTLESKLVKGLYFAGEVLDLDADTGGYNLQIAYSTGYLAGCLPAHGTI